MASLDWVIFDAMVKGLYEQRQQQQQQEQEQDDSLHPTPDEGSAEPTQACLITALFLLLSLSSSPISPLPPCISFVFHEDLACLAAR